MRRVCPPWGRNVNNLTNLPTSLITNVDSVIKERGLKLILIGHCKNWNDLNEIDPESFDVALIFDDQPEGVKSIGATIGIPGDKLLPLW